jgi:RNA polymerase sigma-70 factor (ECF subfamily)
MREGAVRCEAAVLAARAMSLQGGWLEAFHAGDRRVLAEAYRDHYEAVAASVGRVLTGADRDTVVQETFLRLLGNDEVRKAFQGGSFGAWLSMVARNQAIDFLRRRDREIPADTTGTELGRATASFQEAADARIVIERFKREALPAKWHRTFELRFLQQLDQHEVGAATGQSRTTIAYQEYRIRALLRRYLLDRRAER